MIPEFKRCCIRGEARMQDAVFDMDGSLDGKWPKPIAKVNVDKHGASHGY